MTGITYQTTRAGAKWFDDRSAYFSARVTQAPAPYRICHVMAKAIIDANLMPTTGRASPWKGFPWLTPVLGSGCLEVGTSRMLSPDSVAREVENRVREILTPDQVSMGGKLDQADLAVGFTAALVNDRSLPERDIGEGQDKFIREVEVEGGGVDAPSARIVLLAALLTRLFLLSKAYGRTPLQRFEQEEDQLNLPRNAAGVAHDENEVREVRRLRDLCRSHLDIACEDPDSLKGDVEDGVPQAIEALLKQIRKDLVATWPHISIGKLRLLTEVAWYLIARGTAIYPGWTDVLVRLALNDDEPDQATSRPWFRNVRYLGERVEPLLLGATEKSLESWTTNFGGSSRAESAGVREATERQQLYSAVADVLWAQSAARGDARVDDGQSNLPVASAFIVSFDIELEMALWFGSGEDRPFYVVTPVQVLTDSNDQRAQLCWLRGRYRRAADDADLLPTKVLESRLRRPEAWELVQSGMEDLDGPHVVRMSGCPLLRLPKWSDEVDRELLTEIWKSLGAGSDSRGPEDLEVVHAVTIDEYLARQHFETEMAWALSEGRPNLALPDLILGSAQGMDEGENPRFWMTVGVPVADTAVRERLVTQLTLGGIPSKVPSRPFGEQGGDNRGAKASPLKGFGKDDPEEVLPHDTDAAGGSAAPDSDRSETDTAPAEGMHAESRGPGLAKRLAGVVVNSSITAEEAGILCWLGFDVVRDRAQEFVKDLCHYALHLEPPERHLELDLARRCSLDAGGR